jgi:hypothetical protein
MIEKVTKRITTTSTWAENSALTPVDLPREGIVTEVKVRFHVTVDTSLATGAGCVDPDGLYRTLEYLEIVGDGGRTYLGAVGEQMGRLLGLWNLYDFGCPMISLPDSATEDITFVFHPGSNPRDPFDMTAAIPAKALSTFQAKVHTSTDDEVINNTGSNDGIASGTFYYEVSEVMGVPVPPGLKTPLGSTFTWASDATYSDFSKEIDIPAGSFLRRIIMLVQDETAISSGTSTGAVRKDDEVTGVRIKLPRAANKIVLEQNWEDLKVSCAKKNRIMGSPFAVADVEHFQVGIPDGFVIVDLRDYFDPIYGMDLTNYQTGDVKLGLTIGSRASGDDVIIYYDQLAPVESQYVGR